MPPPIPKIALTIAEPGRHLLARERVADDAEREGEDAARDALQHASGDHDLDRPARAQTTAPAVNSSRTAVRTRPLP